MTETKDLERAGSLAATLGMQIAMGLERSSWAHSFERAVGLSSEDEVRWKIAHRVANIFCLVIKDTGFGDLDALMNGLSQGIEDGFVRWGDFSASMKHHGHPEALAEIESRVMDQHEHDRALASPRPKRL